MHNRRRGPDSGFEDRAKDFKASLKKLFKSLSVYKKQIIIAIILSFASSILSIIGPDLIKELTTVIQTGLVMEMDLDKVYFLVKVLAVMYVTSGIFNYAQTFIMNDVSNYYAKGLRSRLSEKINRLPLKFFDDSSNGDILSRVTNDVDTTSSSMISSLSGLVGAFTLIIGSVIMMFATSWILAVSAITASLFGFILLSIIMPRSQKYFIARQKSLGDLNAHIEESYSNHNVVKVYNGSEEALDKFNKHNEELYGSGLKSQFLSGLMQPIMIFTGNFSYLVVCVVGAILVLNKTLVFADIIAFIIYIRLFSNPLSQIAQSLTSLQSTVAASERVFGFLEAEELPSEKKNTKYLDKNKVKGTIEFKDVTFGYNEDKLVIKGFNSLVKPGMKVAIVGPTGAGKTTIVNLLMKFYDLNSGDIKIDGVSLNDLTRENVRELFIMVLQDSWLFNGTIRDNIVYNKEKISDEEIFKILETVGIDHFIRSLPNGLDYDISDNDSISSGQKQLLTIARAVIKDGPFLILDEATSYVDTRTEELVQKAMDKLMKKRTSFIIAHRLSTIKNADLILVMRDGNIIEQGTHDELLTKEGFYSELYNAQFKN